RRRRHPHLRDDHGSYRPGALFAGGFQLTIKTLIGRTTMKTKFWLWTVAAGSLLLSPLTGASAAEKVTIGNSSYAVADVLSNILKSVIEENYGVDVDPISAKGAVAWKAMSDGQGAIDARVDIWLPNSQGYVDEYVKKAGTVALAGPITDARQGFCITKNMQ